MRELRAAEPFLGLKPLAARLREQMQKRPLPGVTLLGAALALSTLDFLVAAALHLKGAVEAFPYKTDAGKLLIELALTRPCQRPLFNGVLLR